MWRIDEGLFKLLTQLSNSHIHVALERENAVHRIILRDGSFLSCMKLVVRLTKQVVDDLAVGPHNAASMIERRLRVIDLISEPNHNSERRQYLQPVAFDIIDVLRELRKVQVE